MAILPTVTIGTREFTLPILTIYRLENCWGAIQSLGTADNMIAQVNCLLRIVTCSLEDSPEQIVSECRSLNPNDDEKMRQCIVDRFKREMLPSQFGGIDRGVATLLRISGLGGEPGNAQPGELTPPEAK